MRSNKEQLLYLESLNERKKDDDFSGQRINKSSGKEQVPR